MTIFGPDISSYQSGLDLSRLADASFIIAKTTEGTYYTDADYQGWREQAAQLRKPFIWYHFLSDEPAAAQAAHTAANVGDRSLPGMLDAEPAGSYAPTLAQILAYVDAAHAARLNLRLVYLPRWYWQHIGSPSLAGLAARGVQLVSSGYPGGTGTPAEIYPGDGAAGWAAYGGMTPLIYQFTNQASDGGKSLDYNAFRGTTAQLAAYLPPAAAPTDPPPTTSEDDMAGPTFSEGQINTGHDATTVIAVPPANYGSAGWGNVWFSLGAAFGEAHLEVSVYEHGSGWRHLSPDFLVPDGGDRVNPLGGPLPTAAQKIAVKRCNGSENVPVAYLIEAVAR